MYILVFKSNNESSKTVISQELNKASKSLPSSQRIRYELFVTLIIIITTILKIHMESIISTPVSYTTS